MGNLVALMRRILTQTHQHSVEIRTEADGTVVVFVGRRGLAALYEIAKYLGTGNSLKTAMIVTAKVSGNARFIFHDDDAVELRLLDGERHPIDETVLYSPEWRHARQEAAHGVS